MTQKRPTKAVLPNIEGKTFFADTTMGKLCRPSDLMEQEHRLKFCWAPKNYQPDLGRDLCEPSRFLVIQNGRLSSLRLINTADRGLIVSVVEMAIVPRANRKV